MAVLHLEGGAECEFFRSKNKNFNNQIIGVVQSAFREEVPSRLRPRQDSYEAGGLDYYLLGPRYSGKRYPGFSPQFFSP